jgi:2-oxoglutarate ferredoxin oxidoreductase subunit alpha
LTIEAFNLSERFRQPVILLSDEVVGHMREKIVIPEKGSYNIVDRKRPKEDPEKFVPYKPDPEDDIPPMASFGDGYRWHVTGLTHNQWGFPTNDPDIAEEKILRLMRKVRRFKGEIVKYDTYEVEDAEILVVAYGSVSRTALSAVREARSRGMRVGFFRPITLWPFPDDELRGLLGGAKSVLVPELNCGQMILEVERVVGGKPRVFGKGLVNGELFRPSEIFDFIKEVA